MKLLDSSNAPAPTSFCLTVVVTSHDGKEWETYDNVEVSIVGTMVCVDGTLYDLECYDVVITRQLEADSV